MISVIITTYKGSNCLERAISSVLMQKDVEFELLVVDDNNPDSVERKKTEEVMKKYEEDVRVRYLKHAKNMNGSVARNTGIKEAKGKYISFLDDDDFYLEGRLKACEDYLEKTGHDGIYTNVLIFKGKNIFDYHKIDKQGCLFLDIMLDENFLGTGSNLFLSKKSMDRIGLFDETLRRNQDYEYLLRFFSKGYEMDCLPECYVVKAMNGTNNAVKYDVLKDVKQYILKKYEENISKYSSEEIKAVKCATHMTLYECSIQTATADQIKEEEGNVKRYGGTISFKSKIKRMIWSVDKKAIVQKLFWRWKANRVKNMVMHECAKEYSVAKKIICNK